MTGVKELDQIAEMQQAGRLLLRHVIRRYEKTLIGSGSTEELGKDIGLLTMDAADVARGAEDRGRLVRFVDDLSRRAAPANLNTIELTCAYLRTDANIMRDEKVVSRARGLRLIFGLIFIFAAVVTVAAIAVLAHVDSGRRSAQLLEGTRKEISTIFADMGKTPPAAWIKLRYSDDHAKPSSSVPGEYELPYMPFCDADPGSKQPYRAPNYSKDGLQAQIICSQYNEAQLRQKLVFRRIREWNCETDFVLLRGGCKAPASTKGDAAFGGNNAETPLAFEAAPVNGDDGMIEAWRGTELRTYAVISNLTGFLLPTLLGCIGGCAYVLRRLDRKLASFTLDDNDGMHAILRVLLATMLGGLLGVVWSADRNIEIGGYTLTLAAVAFFVGFALEVVFSTIESLVEGVASKVRSGP